MIRYGYVTNTKIKFVIIVDAGNITLRDGDIRGVSFALYIARRPVPFAASRSFRARMARKCKMQSLI